jgi:parallel beta-helix repeat protein
MNSMKISALSMLSALSAAAQIPVNCGDTLSVAGGQYVLTGNLVCPASPAVHITANNVSLNLQGFTLSKSGPAIGAGVITASGPACVVTTGVAIYNGTISGFGTAVSLCVPTPPGPVSTHAQIHDLVLTGNSTGVALLNANDNDVHHNTIHANTGIGGFTPGIGVALVNAHGNQLKQNEVTGNSADGVSLQLGSDDNTIMNNQVNGNAGSGIALSLGSLDNVVKHNTATGNSIFDLSDANSACGSNTWQTNTFGTKSQACIK